MMMKYTTENWKSDYYLFIEMQFSPQSNATRIQIENNTEMKFYWFKRSTPHILYPISLSVVAHQHRKIKMQRKSFDKHRMLSNCLLFQIQSALHAI